MSTLQPSASDRATLYAIAWDIVKRHWDVTDKVLSAQDVAAEVAHVYARMVVDGGAGSGPSGRSQVERTAAQS